MKPPPPHLVEREPHFVSLWTGAQELLAACEVRTVLNGKAEPAMAAVKSAEGLRK